MPKITPKLRAQPCTLQPVQTPCATLRSSLHRRTTPTGRRRRRMSRTHRGTTANRRRARAGIVRRRRPRPLAGLASNTRPSDRNTHRRRSRPRIDLGRERNRGTRHETALRIKGRTLLQVLVDKIAQARRIETITGQRNLAPERLPPPALCTSKCREVVIRTVQRKTQRIASQLAQSYLATLHVFKKYLQVQSIRSLGRP